MVLDSHSTNGPSSMVGTSPFGFNARYCGVLTTPKLPPASRRWYCWPSSSQHHSTFCTLTELFRPQILSIASSSEGERQLTGVPALILAFVVSICRRAMLILFGSTGRLSRPNQPAASISFGSGAISPATQSQLNAIMSECGKGHDWLEK